jgi:hypothetical protein
MYTECVRVSAYISSNFDWFHLYMYIILNVVYKYVYECRGASNDVIPSLACPLHVEKRKR